MRIIKDIEQQTPEWHELKKGKISGTKLEGVLGGPKAQDTKMYELLAEKYLKEDDLKAWEILERGNMLEDVAKVRFEEIMDKTVEEVGFIEMDDKHGLSPDGIIASYQEDDGFGNMIDVYEEALEIKCPRGKNYVKYLIEDVIPKEYKAQVVNYFIVMDSLTTLHFMIYNPDVIGGLKDYHIITVTRAELEIDIRKAKEKLVDFRNRWDSLENTLLTK